MSDQRIQYDEEMVGAGHPTKPDTLNRLALVEHGSDGGHALEDRGTDPDAPAAGYRALYFKDGVLMSKDSSGAVEEVGMNVQVERGQYAPTLSGSGAVVTKTITLSNPGVSLDRMRLWWRVGSGVYYNAGGSYFMNESGTYGLGGLKRAYLSAVDTITLEIEEHTSNNGTSWCFFCWTVERW